MTEENVDLVKVHQGGTSRTPEPFEIKINRIGESWTRTVRAAIAQQQQLSNGRKVPVCQFQFLVWRVGKGKGVIKIEADQALDLDKIAGKSCEGVEGCGAIISQMKEKQRRLGSGEKHRDKGLKPAISATSVSQKKLREIRLRWNTCGKS